MSSFGAAATSLTVVSNANTPTPLLTIAVEATVKTDPGSVVLVPTNVTAATFVAKARSVTVGALPDMIVATPDGTRLLTANEGEPNSYNQPDSVDPEGSVSIIDISAGLALVNQTNVTTVDFTDFNVGGPRADELPAGVRIYGPNATVAQDLEPEYITVSPDGATAYVTL